jgi:hypothetical protein
MRAVTAGRSVVELDGLERSVPVGVEKGGDLLRMQVGDGHLGDRRILEEVEGGGAPLQAGTEHEHLHT